MAQLVKMKIGESGTVLVEVQEEAGYRSLGVEGVVKAIDKAFDKLVQQQIIENCRVLSGAFEQLKKQSPAPGKVTAEFGLQINAEGNIYIVKTSGQASFKISVEWQL